MATTLEHDAQAQLAFSSTSAVCHLSVQYSMLGGVTMTPYRVEIVRVQYFDHQEVVTRAAEEHVE